MTGVSKQVYLAKILEKTWSRLWVVGLLASYSAAYTSRLEQQRFTISEVAADWHELMS